jgi:Uma2 family endonuclease
LVRKADEYRGLAATAHLVMIEPERLQAVVWNRRGGDWVAMTLAGPDAVIELSSIGVTLPFSDIYTGVLDLTD